MSYILDALRKAEADRARGDVPGLHTQATEPFAQQPARWGRWRTTVPWLLAAVAVGVAGVLVWRQSQPSTVVPLAVVPPAVAPAVVSTDAGAAADASAVAPPVRPPALAAVVPPPAASIVAPTSGRPAGRTGAARPVTSTTDVAAAVSAAPPPSAAVPSSAARPPPAAAAAEPEAPIDRRIYTIAELPEATRRDLPALSIAGASYSDHPANRLLIVNGNVFHEGDHLAPDLVLEHIDLKSAVLRFRGVHVGVSY